MNLRKGLFDVRTFHAFSQDSHRGSKSFLDRRKGDGAVMLDRLLPEGRIAAKGKRKDRRWRRHLNLVLMFAWREWRSKVAASYMHADSASATYQSAAHESRVKSR
jgi:hypothetical protein